MQWQIYPQFAGNIQVVYTQLHTENFLGVNEVLSVTYANGDNTPKGVVHPFFDSYNANTIKSYKISQKLSPKHAACGVMQSPYPIYRHGKPCLSKQPPWHAAGDRRLAHSRSRVRAPGPSGRCFFLHPPFLRFFFTFPTNPAKVLWLKPFLNWGCPQLQMHPQLTYIGFECIPDSHDLQTYTTKKTKPNYKNCRKSSPLLNSNTASKWNFYMTCSSYFRLQKTMIVKLYINTVGVPYIPVFICLYLLHKGRPLLSFQVKYQ